MHFLLGSRFMPDFYKRGVWEVAPKKIYIKPHQAIHHLNGLRQWLGMVKVKTIYI